MKLTTKQITMAAALLAVCIVSQLFKNLSPYITGPIINAALIIAALYCGLPCGLILSILTPVTSYFITGAKVMSVIPAIIPCIMLGNSILVLSVSLLYKGLRPENGPFYRKFGKRAGLILPLIIGSLVKALVMGGLISLFLLPQFLPEQMLAMLPALQLQFSLTQLITALIGSTYAFAIDLALQKAFPDLRDRI